MNPATKADTYEVNVSVTGLGTVVSQPGLIFCRGGVASAEGQCRDTFSSEAQAVRLRATPARGYLLESWSFKADGADITLSVSGAQDQLTDDDRGSVQNWSVTFKADPTFDGGVDAGEPDAGEPDAGEPDAGEPDAGEIDAGEIDAGEIDAGQIDAGLPSCSPGSCDAGFTCASSGACLPLQVAVTQISVTGPVATLVPFNAAAVPTALTLAGSRYPRFDRSGQNVAFVEDTAGVATDLRVTSVATPLVASSSVITPANAGTLDFLDLEFEPGPALLWTQSDGGTIGGLQSALSDGGALTQISGLGRNGVWADAGTHVVYSIGAGAAAELFVVPAAGGTAVSLDAGWRPAVSADGAVAHLFFDGAPVSGFDGELRVVPLGGGAPVTVAAAVVATGGSPAGSFIAEPSWSPRGTYLSFVRVHYQRVSAVNTLCGGAGTTCTGPTYELVLQPMSAGATSGAPISLSSLGDGRWPSLSADDSHLAFITPAGTLRVQQLDATGQADGGSFTHDFTPAGLTPDAGEDHRPRWQPIR